MGLFDKIKNKNLQEKKKNNPGDALRKAIGKQAELDAAKDFQKDVGKNITPELKNTCLLYTSPSPRDTMSSRMPSSA